MLTRSICNRRKRHYLEIYAIFRYYLPEHLNSPSCVIDLSVNVKDLSSVGLSQISIKDTIRHLQDTLRHLKDTYRHYQYLLGQVRLTSVYKLFRDTSVFLYYSKYLVVELSQ